MTIPDLVVGAGGAFTGRKRQLCRGNDVFEHDKVIAGGIVGIRVADVRLDDRLLAQLVHDLDLDICADNAGILEKLQIMGNGFLVTGLGVVEINRIGNDLVVVNFVGEHRVIRSDAVVAVVGGNAEDNGIIEEGAEGQEVDRILQEIILFRRGDALYGGILRIDMERILRRSGIP